MCRNKFGRGEPCSNNQQCLSDQFCMATQEGNVCRNKFGRGESCSNNQQCLSNQCTLSLCVEDECLGSLITEGCLPGQFSMETQAGNVFRNKFGKREPCSDNQQCLSDQFCMATWEGNVCRNKFGRGEPCSNNEQCLSDQCALSLCVEDECLGPLITEGCLPDQFCMATQEGNVCRNKFGRGDPCSNNQQCLTNQCTLSLCVEDECPGSLITEGCLPDQFCMATQEGNVCRNKFGRGDPCSDFAPITSVMLTS